MKSIRELLLWKTNKKEKNNTTEERWKVANEGLIPDSVPYKIVPNQGDIITSSHLFQVFLPLETVVGCIFSSYLVRGVHLYPSTAIYRSKTSAFFFDFLDPYSTLFCLKLSKYNFKLPNQNDWDFFFLFFKQKEMSWGGRFFAITFCLLFYPFALFSSSSSVENAWNSRRADHRKFETLRSVRPFISCEEGGYIQSNI